MSAINPAFLKFIQEIQAKGSISQAIQNAQRFYKLKTYKISQITSGEATKIYDSIYLKFYKGHSQTISSNWIFVWTLVCYIYLYQKQIEDLGEVDWTYFSTIFDRKDPKLFEYQCQALCASEKGKNWLKQQEDLLRKIMQNKINTAKWNEVSKELYQLSDKKYFRTAKQCRQRWNNHLDPSKIKGFWKAQQCLQMFEYVKHNGKKWASLVKILNYSRNQHSIKNKFNSIIKKHRKTSNTQFEQLIYDQIINRIKKSMENKIIFENAEISFDLEQLNQQYQALNYKKKQNVDQPACHKVTQNFFKLLQNFNPKDPQEQSKLDIKQQENQVQVIEVKEKKVDVSPIQKQPAPAPQYRSIQTQTNIKIQNPSQQKSKTGILPNMADINNLVTIGKARVVKCSVVSTPVLFYRIETAPTSLFIPTYDSTNNKQPQYPVNMNMLNTMLMEDKPNLINMSMNMNIPPVKQGMAQQGIPSVAGEQTNNLQKKESGQLTSDQIKGYLTQNLFMQPLYYSVNNVSNLDDTIKNFNLNDVIKTYTSFSQQSAEKVSPIEKDIMQAEEKQIANNKSMQIQLEKY